MALVIAADPARTKRVTQAVDAFVHTGLEVRFGSGLVIVGSVKLPLKTLRCPAVTSGGVFHAGVHQATSAGVGVPPRSAEAIQAFNALPE